MSATYTEVYEAVRSGMEMLRKIGAHEEVVAQMGQRHLDAIVDNHIADEMTCSRAREDLLNDGYLTQI